MSRKKRKGNTMTVKEIQKDGIPDIRRRFRREWWSYTTSVMRFIKNGKLMFNSNEKISDIWINLGKTNQAADDWYEINEDFERIIYEKYFNLAPTLKTSAIQKKINELNKELNQYKGPLPNELDRDAWKELWEDGMEVQASYADSNDWNEIRRPRGGSFHHSKGKVKFRKAQDVDKSI